MKKREEAVPGLLWSEAAQRLLVWVGIGLALLCGYLWQWPGDGRFGIGFAAGFF